MIAKQGDVHEGGLDFLFFQLPYWEYFSSPGRQRASCCDMHLNYTRLHDHMTLVGLRRCRVQMKGDIGLEQPLGLG